MKKYTILVLYIFAYIYNASFIYSQDFTKYDQASVDSLKQVYHKNSNDENIWFILKTIIQEETNPEQKLYYANLLIEHTERNTEYLNLDINTILNYKSIAYIQKGNALQLLGEYHEALDAYFKSMELAKADKDEDFAGSLLVSIADTYSIIGNSETAQKYYDEALVKLRKSKNTLDLASALLNAGDEYLKTKQFSKALENFNESGKLFELLNHPVGKAYNKGNTGMVYAKQGKHELAKANINEAITILEDIEDFYPISVYLHAMSDIYVEQQDYITALDYGYRSLDLAKTYNLKDQLSEANLQLSELLELIGNSQEALEYYKTHIVYRDSLRNLENIQKLANHEVERNELKVENLEQKRKTQRILLWSTIGVLVFIGIFAYGLFNRNKFIHKTNTIISAEKERSDNLLLNILPEETAHELKTNGRVEAKKFESVTVLFSDFKGFTHYAENLPPEVLVETVDHYFSEFDLIMEKYNLEKIKTVGDAYMAAGGLPFETQDHAKKMILAAKDMAEFVANAKHDDKTSATFDIRIGINTGPVVAGVVGTKKFAYDIWGDTVNIASRMESNSEPGRINISDETYKHIKSDFDCEYRGTFEVKNRGQMKMYFVNV
ncbi:adenylate/guanylate cyclase domain-containing protein [Ichthyenterobacterium magnum]|uniref:Adenylate cyclase n=1 Tax=Ichthyenterobacterium magnum TaxID=1230530 RepID=A0A420DMD4_9FLAO|nr:adenylate/guanylate cyclase domain-containing protein [Ichthyenterobacterium magnum]RKE95371.1 class 3 adenylate cyclase [Ichthyenterobacterium magnum]